MGRYMKIGSRKKGLGARSTPKHVTLGRTWSHQVKYFIHLQNGNSSNGSELIRADEFEWHNPYPRGSLGVTEQLRQHFSCSCYQKQKPKTNKTKQKTLVSYEYRGPVISRFRLCDITLSHAVVSQQTGSTVLIRMSERGQRSKCLTKERLWKQG